MITRPEVKLALTLWWLGVLRGLTGHLTLPADYGGYCLRTLGVIVARLWHWQNHQRRFWATVLCLTYTSLFLFASACAGTGIFHRDSHGKASHQHDHSHSRGPLPVDLCDYALRALTTTSTPVPFLPTTVMVQEPVVSPVIIPIVAAQYFSRIIRAPPVAFSS